MARVISSWGISLYIHENHVCSSAITVKMWIYATFEAFIDAVLSGVLATSAGFQWKGRYASICRLMRFTRCPGAKLHKLIDGFDSDIY